MQLLIASLLVAVLSMMVCHAIARRRGASARFWGAMGVLFGPFAIPFALLAKAKKSKSRES